METVFLEGGRCSYPGLDGESLPQHLADRKHPIERLVSEERVH